MDNLKNLEALIEQHIDPNGTPGSILAENHQAILKEVLTKVGKWTGSAFVAQKNATTFPSGTFSWNNNALNTTSDFVITTSKNTSDLNDFGRVLNTMVTGDLIRFKDFNGRSVFLNYKSHANGLDASGNPTWNITVNGFVDNPNYIYQTAETSIAIVSINKTTGVGKTYVDDQDDAFLVLAKQYTDEQIAGVIQPMVLEFALNHDVNLDFVPFMRWRFPGIAEFSLTKPITLTASDPTLDRIDVIAGNKSGDIVVIEGTPASEPAKPDVDPDTQIEATFILIKAGATAPDGVTRSTIYNENTQSGGGEWNTSKNAGTRINLASAVDFYSGTVSIEGTAMNNLDAVEFTPTAPIPIADFPELKLRMKNKDDTNPVDPFRVQIIGNRSNGKSETLFLSNPSSVGYSPTSLIWQSLNFGVASSTIVEITKVRWVNYASNADQFGMFVDSVTFAGGTNAPQPAPVETSISVQDVNGVEQFKINKFVRFGNVLFDSLLKQITLDLSNVVEKVTGKSLIADTEISRLANLNDRFKGKFTTLGALQTAVPSANAGDYAQVDTGGSNPVSNYNWDIEDGWVIGSTGGSGATNTDELIEGSTNLYFTGARVLSTILSGLSLATGGAIVSTDSVLIAFGKIQKQINDLTTSVAGKQATLVSGTNIKTINGSSILGSGDLVVGGGGGTSIQNRYSTISELLADQANQSDKGIQFVTDASTDTTVTTGFAYYEKLTTTTASLTDYRKMSESESMDVIAGNDPTSTPLQAYAVYIDVINGSDADGRLYDPNKPFKTISALLSALPDNYSTYWRIFIIGGGSLMMPKTKTRNLIWSSTGDAILDFSNVVGDFCLTDQYRNSEWRFENGNISLQSNFVGVKIFGALTTRSYLSLTGHINTINWISTSTTTIAGSIIVEFKENNRLLINQVTTSNQYLFQIFTNITPEPYAEMSIGKLTMQNGKFPFYSVYNNFDLVVNDVSGSNGLQLNYTGTFRVVTIRKISITAGEFAVRGASVFKFDRCTYPDNANIRFYLATQVEGDLIGNTPIGGQFLYDNYFKRFTAYLVKLSQFSNTTSGWTFEDCNIRLQTGLATYNRSHPNIGSFKGHNTFTSDVANSELITIGSGLSTANVNKYGTLKTNCVITGINNFVDHTPNTF